jgi:hypothetical protein
MLSITIDFAKSYGIELSIFASYDFSRSISKSKKALFTISYDF